MALRIQTKTCSKCKKEKSLTEFSITPKSKSGYSSHCKQCKREYSKKFRETASGVYSAVKGRNKFYNNHLFKISRKEFKDWYDNEPKVCHYCGLPEELLPKFNKKFKTKGVRFTIDCKDNDIGYVKGNLALACDKCNTMKSNYVPYKIMCEISEKYMKGIWQSIFLKEGKLGTL